MASGASPWAAQWDLVGANHNQFVDDRSACNGSWSQPLWCRACRGGTASDATVRAAVRTLAAAFFLRHLEGATEMDPYLTGTRVPSGVTVTKRP